MIDSPGRLMAVTPGRGALEFRQGILRQRSFGTHLVQVLQPLPASRHEVFLFGHVCGIQLSLAKSATGCWGVELSVSNELGHNGVALQVSLGTGQQCLRGDLPGDKPQVQVTLPDVVDFFSAYIAEIALVAPGHIPVSAVE